MSRDIVIWLFAIFLSVGFLVPLLGGLTVLFWEGFLTMLGVL